MNISLKSGLYDLYATSLRNRTSRITSSHRPVDATFFINLTKTIQ